MFQIGDKVTWESQARGHTKEKRGTVAQVVPAGERPSREQFPYLYKSVRCGFGRCHESYVVLVGKKPYWPVANKLRHAP